MPRDPVDDELMKQVMDQLGAALGQLDTDSLRDAVQLGLREALDALDDSEHGPVADSERPQVVVLEGGLADEARRAAEPHDGLHVVHDASEPTDEVDATVSVQVLRHGAEGWLAPQGDWQLVYRGEAVAVYRLALTAGRVEVSVDDQIVATLSAGQSCDVAGARVLVRGDGQGAYHRLS